MPAHACCLRHPFRGPFFSLYSGRPQGDDVAALLLVCMRTAPPLFLLQTPPIRARWPLLICKRPCCADCISASAARLSTIRVPFHWALSNSNSARHLSNAAPSLASCVAPSSPSSSSQLARNRSSTRSCFCHRSLRMTLPTLHFRAAYVSAPVQPALLTHKSIRSSEVNAAAVLAPGCTSRAVPCARAFTAPPSVFFNCLLCGVPCHQRNRG